ncbi:MFS transporter [Tianweitania sp. BSSL-BM11]|uniref:MFS transporter n=1 Tax=Tianweitania aestuarii TaxID=2814886 RepID=A0ABS5RYZ5_9HYPH|nr:MFS transporter [Tianweitania aestuarii]MBS9722248.1 MFS transporter [Tianweitania aestuarii]
MAVTIDDRATARRGRWAVAAMFCTNGFIVGSWAPQIPLLMTRLDIREATMGLLILGFGLGALIAMPSCGLLIPRFGSRKVLTAFALTCTLGLLLVVATSSVWLAVPALVIFGALVGGMDVAMNTNAVAVERKLGKAIMSASHGFWSLGGFAGGGLGGLTIQRFGALPHAAFVAGLTLIVVIVAIRFLLSEDQPAAETRTKTRFPRQPAVYIVGLIALFGMIPEGAVLDWAAIYLREERGADIATAGFAFAAFCATMATMRFLGDIVRNRFGAVQTLRVSSLIAAVGIFVAGLSPTPWLAIAAFAFAGFGLANIIPIAFSAAGNQPGISSAAGMSVVTTLGYSGILVAPSFIGFIAQSTGFAPIYLGLSALLVFVFFAARFAAAADGARSGH